MIIAPLDKIIVRLQDYPHEMPGGNSKKYNPMGEV